MPANAKLLKWLRLTCTYFNYDVLALFKASGTRPAWPMIATDQDDLCAKLGSAGHLLPLPKEPAALANIMEVSIVDFLIAELTKIEGTGATRGGERGYPDIEISGSRFGDGFHAVDVKVAQRKKSRAKRPKPPTSTQSRITLYTGNTYFMYPTEHLPGSLRPFGEYMSHTDVIVLYTLNETSTSRVDDLELIVQEPWRIASKKRSSTTREYLGAVKELDRLRGGTGDFASEAAFYDYWRKHNFVIGKRTKKLLQKVLAEAERRRVPETPGKRRTKPSQT